jgi:phosphoglycerate dehydrogenase-like enzyme
MRNALFAPRNTVLTPHVAGMSPQASLLTRTVVAENIVSVLGGRPVNVVNDEALGLPSAVS